MVGPRWGFPRRGPFGCCGTCLLRTHREWLDERCGELALFDDIVVREDRRRSPGFRGACRPRSASPAGARRSGRSADRDDLDRRPSLPRGSGDGSCAAALLDAATYVIRQGRQPLRRDR